MPDKILHKRSFTPGSKPTTSNLDPGEFAINVNDGKVFLRKSGSGTDIVTELISTNTVNTGSITISGSVIITGSLDVSGSITGSLFGTASWAQSASIAISSSYALSASYTLSSSYALSASYAVSSSYTLSSSYAVSSSYAFNATSTSFAATASSADNFLIRNGATFSGSINHSGSFTLNGTLTATTLIVQDITSSREFITGSSKFGSIITNSHQFTGSVLVTGSITVIDGVTNNLTASWANRAISASIADTAVTASRALQSNTASYVLNAVSSSYALSASNAQTASYVLNAVSSSYALSASNAQTSSYILNAISSSYALSASNAQTASFILNAVSSSYALSASNAQTASYVLNAVSSSYALSASNAQTASFISTASWAINASNALTSSWATNVNTASWATNASNALTSSWATNVNTASWATNAVNAMTASWVQNVSPTSTNAFVQNGNSFGATATLGTNDNYPLAIETNGSTRLFITGSEIISSIQYLGATSASNSTTITLPSTLAGGGLIENDLVIIASIHGNVSASIPTGSDGIVYTSTTNVFTSSMGYMWAYKFMSSTPDTTATGITGSTLAFAFRNVSRNSPFNVSGSASGSTGMPDPPSITTTVNSSMIVALGFLDRDAGFAITAPASYTLIGYTGSIIAANSGSVMAAYFQQTSPGAENPAAFGGTGTDLFAASTFALTPITSSGNIGINNPNPLTTLHIGTPVSTDFNLTNKAPVRISTPSSNISGAINEALFLDHNHGDFTSGSGTAIVMGTKSPLYGGYTSRIINYTNTNNNTGTRLQLQTQTALSNNTWNTGILINESGNVGIGTISPSSKLHVSGAVNSSWLATIDNVGTTDAHGLLVNIGASSTGVPFGVYKNLSTPLLYVSNAGNVGIGTATPSTGKLQINTGTANNNALTIQADTVTARTYGIGITSDASLNFYDNSAAASRLFISASGNVGIGTTTPTFPLTIALAGSNASRGIGIGTSVYTTLGQTLSGVMSILGHNVYVDTAANNTVKVLNSGWHASMIKMYYDQGITFHTTGSLQNANATFFDNSAILNERMRIDSNGNVGIGTSTPNSRVEILGGSLATGGNGIMIASGLTTGRTGTYDASTVSSLHTYYDDRTIEISGGSSAGWVSGISVTGNNATLYKGTIRFTTISAERMRIDSSGNVGIGITGPAYKLDVNGTTRITGSLSVGTINPSATTGRIDASNDIVAYSTSDIRFKTNITPISGALDKITQIGGYEFDWIPSQEHHGFEGHDVGVIAQEIEKVLPEVVKKRDNGYKAVKYEKIVPLLIEAIKEQQKQIDDLQKQINYLVENKT